MGLIRFLVRNIIMREELDWSDPSAPGRRWYLYWWLTGGENKPGTEEESCHYLRVVLFHALRRYLWRARMNVLVRPWTVIPFLALTAFVAYAFYFHTGTALMVLLWCVGVLFGSIVVMFALAFIGWFATNTDSARLVAFRRWLRTVLGPVGTAIRWLWIPFDRILRLIYLSGNTVIGILILIDILAVIASPFLILAFIWVQVGFFWFSVTVAAITAIIVLGAVWAYLFENYPKAAAGIMMFFQGIMFILMLLPRVLILLKRFGCVKTNVGEMPERNKATA